MLLANPRSCADWRHLPAPRGRRRRARELAAGDMAIVTGRRGPSLGRPPSLTSLF